MLMNIKYLNIQQQIVVDPQQPIITVSQQIIVAAAPPPQQPEINEMYDVERELQVLSIEDVEEPWKKKCVELEIKIFDLQTELARYKIQGQELKVTSNEEFQVKELEAKIKMMKDIEDGQRKEIKSQQNEIDSRRQIYSKLQLVLTITLRWRRNQIVKRCFSRKRKANLEIGKCIKF
ncbi:unnamed protein product [Paramecium primaurelia]|uniref:Uncharacterized protein n=1 Tax=Paramecium primaurelia TaxID=5886 RepID=A0A8S1P9E0_PARPR|nr:unnamed protein product [Paramecium primaurelia]